MRNDEIRKLREQWPRDTKGTFNKTIFSADQLILLLIFRFAEIQEHFPGTEGRVIFCP